MGTNLKVYQKAVKLYQQVKTLKLKGAVRDQIIRASMSVCLNLAEGNNRNGLKDRKKFFNIALTSHREVQALIEMEELSELTELADIIGAQLYLLHRNCPL